MKPRGQNPPPEQELPGEIRATITHNKMVEHDITDYKRAVSCLRRRCMCDLANDKPFASYETQSLINFRNNVDAIFPKIVVQPKKALSGLLGLAASLLWTEPDF